MEAAPAMNILFFGILALIGLVINFAIGIMLIVGAVQMLRMRSYGLSLFATVLALVPCNPVSLIGIPIGIWSLLVLNRGQVKAAFRGARPGGA